MTTYSTHIRNRLSRLLPNMEPPRYMNVHPQIEARLASARSNFVQGYLDALSATTEALPLLFETLPFHKLGFALEGAAMAVTMLDEFGDPPGGFLTALLTHRQKTEKVLCAVGIGWASARLGKSYHWLPAELENHHRPFVADGYGFHQGFFHPNMFTDRESPGGNSELTLSYDIGLGRALWFIQFGRFEPIVEVIKRMPLKRQTQLWQGVGIACAFTGNSEHATALKSIDSGFENNFWTGLEAGKQLLDALSRTTKKEIS